MNDTQSGPIEGPPAHFWTLPQVLEALADRDVPRLYRELQLRLGFSQKRIGILTQQSQPEISAIIYGRKVMAYEVLHRIFAGLGAPSTSPDWAPATTSTLLAEQTPKLASPVRRSPSPTWPVHSFR